MKTSSTPSNPLTEEEKKIIDELEEEGYTQTEIGRKINRSQSTVSYYIRNRPGLEFDTSTPRGRAGAKAKSEYSKLERLRINNTSYKIVEKWLDWALTLKPQDLPVSDFRQMIAAYVGIEDKRQLLDPIIAGEGQKSGLESLRESLRQKPAENKDSEEEHNDLADVPPEQ